MVTVTVILMYMGSTGTVLAIKSLKICLKVTKVSIW